MQILKLLSAALIPLTLSAATITETVDTKIPLTPGDTTRFSADFFSSDPGVTALPLIRRRILLPANVDESTISLRYTNESAEQISGTHFVERNGFEYDSDGPLPVYISADTALIRGERIGRYKQFTFVEYMIAPIAYDTITGKLTSVPSVTVEIEYETGTARSTEAVDSRSLEKLNGMVNNAEALPSYGAAKRAGDPHLVIVTTSAIESNLKQLNNFISAKKSRGFKTTVVNETLWGGGSGDESAENLRAWLETNYLDMGIDYLLIIGDPSPEDGDVAMKMTFSYRGGKFAATDYYYSDLTGNWDRDGDGKYGELDDLNNLVVKDGIDAIPEIVVGRIPLYNGNYAEADHILAKTMAYESERDPSWRDNMLLAMYGYSTGEGYIVGEEIWKDLQGTSWGFYRMYQRNTNGCDAGFITEELFTKAWTDNPYGVVTWLTHGKADAAQHTFDTHYARSLTDDYPSFVMMGSCLNGKPEVADNLANTVLAKGAVGVVAGSETTIYSTPVNADKLAGSSYNHGFIYGFTSKLAKNKPFIGDVLTDLKEESDMGCWKNYCAFNLLGDPTIGLDVAGNDPVAVQGSESIYAKSVGVTLAGNQLQISGLTNTAEISLINLRGQTIGRWETRAVNTIASITLPNIAAGTYLVRIVGEKSAVTRRVVMGL